MRVEPMRRATRPLWVGRTMRTAMSASPRARSWLRLVTASSTPTPGLRARKPAKIGGSASEPMISLAVTRTTPRSAAVAEEAERASAAAATAIASAVGTSPRGERVNSVAPSASSSPSMWRPTVGWARPSRRAAPLRAKSRATSRKVRNSSQSGSRPPIRKRIAGQDKYAIPQMSARAYREGQSGCATRRGSKEASMTAILARLAYASAPASACVAGGSASGGVRTVLRLEGAAAFATAIALYGGAGFSWLAFAVLFLAPDVSMLAYLAGPRVGAVAYNLVHTYVLALPVALAG